MELTTTPAESIYGAIEASLAADLGLELSSSMDLRLDLAVSKFNSAARSIVEAGLALLSIKNDCGHGEFEEHLAERGIPSQRASEAMRYAKFSATLPAASRAKVMELPKKRVLALASTEPEVISKALEDDDLFHDLARMDYTEMRKRLRQMEARNADLAVDLDTAQTKINELHNRLISRVDDDSWPEFVTVMRHEGCALSEKALLCVDDLERLVDELSSPAVMSSPHFRVASNGLYTHVNALLHRLSGLVNRMHAELGDTLETNMPETLFSDAEVAQAIADRELLVQAHKQERQLRDNQRETAKPRGRGRPKKQ